MAESVGSGDGAADLVSVAGQQPVRQLPQAFFVFDEQDRLAVAAAVATAGGGRDRNEPSRVGFCWGAGQQRGDGGAEPWLGVDLGVAACPGDDAVDRGEPEPGALALRLGAVERLEYPGEYLTVHARAGVGDTQPGVATRLQARAAGRVALIDGDVAGFDGELPAA